LKILLTTLNSKFIHTNLAIRYLKSYTKDLVDADIREYTINNDLDYILKDIYKNDYDVILFSTYIWNVLDIVKLCENIKKVKPNTIIGLGGPEVTYDSENAMEKYPFVDYILCGEGELVFRDLVMYLQGNKNIEDVEGIVYRNNGEIVVNRPKELLQNLDEIPSPYENLDPKEYENRIVYYETSRGCPFNCQYCLSSTLKGLRYFSIDRVKKDLKALIDARVSQIKFIDRTFNANKKFAKEIMNFLMENDNDYTTYHFEVTAHLLDDDMLEFLSNCKEGLFQFEIGVQTTNQKVLDAVGRRDDFTKLSKVVKKIASYRNIHQHLDLIAGLPYEDYASFENSFNDVFNLGIEHLGFLKMIKGTGVRKTANEHGYKYKDYPPYEVLYNNYISYSQILKLKDIEEILEKYYNSKNFVLSMRYIIFNYYKESPFKFFEEFAIYFDKNGYFDVAQGKNQLYKILLDFYNESINKNNDLFNDILKYDYISLGKTSNIPQFFNKLDMEDFKNRCHVFLQDESNISKYLPNFENKPAKHIIKYVHFEPFKFDILELKKDINKNIDKEDNVVMFVYDDKKIFEKSKAYRVSI
jgi:radical SAM superfamily enzyme YgiQ (UPF0313 family)